MRVHPRPMRGSWQVCIRSVVVGETSASAEREPDNFVVVGETSASAERELDNFVVVSQYCFRNSLH